MVSADAIRNSGGKPATSSWPRLSLSRARWLSPLILLILWELGSRSGVIPSRVLAAPSTVAATAAHMLASGELIQNLVVSLGRVAAGFTLGAATGVVLALVAGLSRWGETLLDPPIQMLRTLPLLALVPLFIVWFGIGETPKVALIALGATFPIYLNLFNAIRSVDPKVVEAARSFGLSGLDLIRDVILPGATPGLLLGVRYALTVSWLFLVVAEQINAQAGLGYLINNARDFLRTDIIVLCLLIYAFLGLASDAAVRALERRALAWRPSFVER
ncbi:MAG: ABC transporter permease subunit [Caulobacteraceae bacterium]